MVILVLNCGSSSVKYQVIDMKSADNNLLAKGQIERIGLNDGILVHKPVGKPDYRITKPIPDHTVAINLILNVIIDPVHGVLSSFADVNAVGHRVTHGGEYFTDSAIVTETVKQHIQNCIDLAPLHNPANLKGILAIENLLPTIQQVAVFDTSYHQTIPPENFLYAIPYRYYEDMRIRKYGFHGTSHKYVAKKACKTYGVDFNNSKIITCHIGNGGSVTAILNGESINTSMGFTPVDGLMMGTRCGSIDPSVLLYIADNEGLNTSKINDLINKESGLYGVAGISSDMRDNLQASDDGNKKARLALNIFNNRVKEFIGSYAALLGGVDMIVFTGGIGEHDMFVRHGACTNMEYMGIKINEEVNYDAWGIDVEISTPDSKVKVVVTKTDEEYVIASDTYRLLSNKFED
ncbi:MAG: acetate kinase [Rikenellaceae bacterium]